MSGVLTRCPRCNRLFSKTHLEVCTQCEEAELSDYDRIRDALSDHPSISAHELTALTGVDLACISRMMDAGIAQHLDSEAEPVKCGMCGAPGISASQKICESCLKKLDAQVNKLRAKAEKHLREEPAMKKGQRMFGVHDAFSSRRR